MEFLQYYNQTQFLGFVPKIKKNQSAWQVVEVSLSGKTRHNTAFIAKQLKEYFGDRDGIIFVCNSKEILVLVNMGEGADSRSLSTGITDKMPAYSCAVESTSVTGDGLLKFQLRMQDLDEMRKSQGSSSLLKERQDRAQKVVMVADDDMFMRSLIGKTFGARTQVIERESANGLIDAYLEDLPDILFLDIHLPGGNGLDLLSEISAFDDTAYVIMISSDSVRTNVMEAKKHGAKGFIAKPFTAEKLEAVYQKCPSIVIPVTAQK